VGRLLHRRRGGDQFPLRIQHAGDALTICALPD
jgi:hypothetical protein